MSTIITTIIIFSILIVNKNTLLIAACSPKDDISGGKTRGRPLKLNAGLVASARVRHSALSWHARVSPNVSTVMGETGQYALVRSGANLHQKPSKLLVICT